MSKDTYEARITPAELELIVIFFSNRHNERAFPALHLDVEDVEL